MNEKIQHIIQEIATKKQLLMDKIHELSLELSKLKQDNGDLEAKLAEMSEKNALLEHQNVELKSELEEARMKNVQIVEQSAQVKALTEQEIDALVGEIDYCLNQLKNN